MDWDLTYTEKNGKDNYGAGKKNVGHSKLRLWIFFRGHENMNDLWVELLINGQGLNDYLGIFRFHLSLVQSITIIERRKCFNCWFIRLTVNLIKKGLSGNIIKFLIVSLTKKRLSYKL